MTSGLTYRDAGVDIDAGEALVQRIKPLAARTRTPHVLADIGGFAGLCRLPSGLEEPVLVASTDGVGTKLQIAAKLGRHDTIGIDLVAMCVNDLVCCGAQPLFFLDYYASAKLSVEHGEAVIRGISDGCIQAGCALLGGETAEMPGSLPPGEYELAGFAVGVVDRRAIIDGTSISAGDVLLGVASSGLHSNGFSLARRALLQNARMSLSEPLPGAAFSLGEELLQPTRIYVKSIQAAIAAGGVRGLCHITGGGLPGNLPRILPDGLAMTVDPQRWHVPAIFEHIARAGGVAVDEMRRTFNLGIGFVLVVAPEAVGTVSEALRATGETVVPIGAVEARAPGAAPVRFL